MAITLYRIQTDAHRDSILEGTGAKLWGGLWNAQGRSMVYTVTTPELCLLEYMVHLDGTPLADLPPLILCEIAVSDHSIRFVRLEELPLGWDNPYATPVGLPLFAEQQFERHKCFCLALPSAIFPLSPSRNVLIDPLHAQRSECRVLSIQSYPIDPRLPTAALAYRAVHVG
ncbi:RES family NAD+ phosphorylase [Spirosoma utsteinense]|uniref:RES domain-containing protein n=1 Tax=Spirosoma utsteinense TaxID=2585773 RepID=A0ABR6W6J1_9BACT|nr:RES family NAD+ phosphorylase [Spirosoma utsteinense]MBC3787899.1 RES domain-containing protein [Spirosoma utsteinense]MBC3792180.1 RES domain-containing protein [Spirosoma utsteinense]